LSARDGAEDTGFSKNAISRALRELQHYGFIVMTKGGCLGVEGKGVAPHWRLTELSYMLDPPTRDFLKWDGEMFQTPKAVVIQA
jgi:DNA-binding HxlR family transcriptional regulator